VRYFTRHKLGTPVNQLWLVLTLVALVAAAVLLGAAYDFWSKDAVPPVRLEIVKSALQVLVVAVIGNLVTLLVQAVQKQRERQASERELRINVLRRAVKNYAAAKKIRRQLRAGGDIRLLFDTLNDVQLEFESMKREVKHAPIFAEARAVANALASMEKYLHGLIKECETARPEQEPQFPFCPVHFKHLADFTGRYKGSDFQAHFARAFDVLLALMQAEILDRPPLMPAATTRVAIAAPSFSGVAETPAAGGESRER